jgi:hypothetical protein
MKIYRNNTEIADVFLRVNSSYEEEEIMGDHLAVIEFDVLVPIEFKLGDYVTVNGHKFSIRYNESVKKTEKVRGFNYVITFHAEMYGLQDTLFFLFGQPERLKNHDFYNGTVAQWADIIVENMNRNDSGWSIGSVIESEAINMSFRDKTCAEVLNDLAGELDTEYWIAGKTVNIGRREYSSNGLSLSQGDGGGLRDIELSAVDDTPPVTVIFPYGSDRNLTKEYGNDYLVLPGGQLSMQKNVDRYGRIEKSMQFEHIFPKGEFHVSAKIDDFTLQASDIDFNLTDCLIGDDVDVIVTFQGTSGLAGYDLVIVKGSWNNTTKQFKLKQNEQENALGVPGDIHFAVGDMFILTELKMPQSYITAAELKLQAAAQEFLDNNSEKRVQLACKCDDIYFKQHNITVACGQMVGIVENRLDINREIRCTKVLRYLENEGSLSRYEITLSDFLQGNGLKDVVNAVKNTPQEIARATVQVMDFARRRIEDVKEAQEMLEKAFANFSPGIDPAWVRTMSVLVGNEYQQIEFVDGITDGQMEVIPAFVMNNSTKAFGVSAAILKHCTLGIENTSSQYAASIFRYWNMASFQSPYLGDDPSPYYLVAKCAKAGTAGTLTSGGVFLLQKEYDYDPGDGYYYFLVGVLSSERNGIRSFATAYGFTEISPGQMRIKMIVSPDGQRYYNVTEGVFQGEIRILTGSSGYNNLTDKPDLGAYQTKVEFNVFKDSISGQVSTVTSTVNGLITQSSGWVTEATGNTLWADKTLEDGTTIVSKINQTAESVKITASHINLVGAVTFSTLDAEVYSRVINALKAGNVTRADLVAALQNEIGGKADSSGLGELAYQSEVGVGDLNTTIVSGGKIIADLLDVNQIFALQASIGNFTISNGWLKCNASPGNDVGYIDMLGPNTRVVFGRNIAPGYTGGSYTNTALIKNANPASYAGNTIALCLQAAGGSGTRSIALDAEGGACIRGITSFIEESAPLDTGISNSSGSSAENLRYYRCFAFQPGSGVNVYLPSGSAISSEFGYFGDGSHPVSRSFIRIHILVTRWATSYIRINAPSSTPLINEQGDTMSYIDLYKGDYVELTYHNQSWYRTAYNW